ncbi:MAG: HAMP domain-containing sensor histidine kinase, partial [Cyanobacteriota bacterium]|nr:HAMP domain-containing sensor histidine kinase [Cyanobacteriota bacterium]
MSWLARRHQLPIRLWLQSASFAAVLLGYALLLLANYQLLLEQLQRRHAYRVDAIETRLIKQPLTRPLAEELRLVSSPDLVVTAMRTCPKASPEAAGLRAYGYTISCRPVQLQGQRQLLVFAEDNSGALADVGMFSLLLTAAAGAAALLTSALLRMVFREGLRPLETFASTLDSITSTNLADQRLPLEQQPPELQRIAHAFNRLLERLHSSWEHQRTFVNAVSHELRTPITLIGGYASRLQRRVANLTAPQQEQLALIHSEATRMGRMVSDLLEIARDDAGRLEVGCEPFEAWPVLVAAQQRLESTVGSRLVLDSPPDGPTWVLGDGERLGQCLSNLIENAVKYAPGSTPITLAASRQGELLVLHVQDQGSGVPEADRQRIFERFVRGSSSATAEKPGSGIGLAVVATLMARMGGEARVAEAPGGGADFQLLLPLVQPLSNSAT